jgi:predicted nucleic acid-binding protein
MILVDTSIWIEILRGHIVVPDEDYEEFCTCGPIVQEFFQGFEDTPAFGSYGALFTNIPRVSDPLPSEVFWGAADIYRQGRRRGLTIRSSIDCLIAAIALENSVVLWHCDRDFDNIAKFTNLRVRHASWKN